MKTQIARSLSNEQLIAELQRVAAEMRTDTLTQPDFEEMSELSSAAISRRLGSWNKALRTAGLRPVNMGRRYSEDDYFENLLTVWTHLGRQPTYAEMDIPPSTITAGAYAKKWANWTKALLAFLKKVNSEGADQPAVTAAERRPFVPIESRRPRQEDRHKISLGLRYNVLLRDKFKCVRCGNSPAVDTTCRLHVDHIVPFSKSGKTVNENLRTLCSACNIGKSSKIEITE